MLKLFLLFFVLTTVAGCAALDGQFTNRLTCTAAKDKAFVVSEYGPFGVSSTVAGQDATVVCK